LGSAAAAAAAESAGGGASAASPVTAPERMEATPTKPKAVEAVRRLRGAHRLNRSSV